MANEQIKCLVLFKEYAANLKRIIETSKLFQWNFQKAGKTREKSKEHVALCGRFSLREFGIAIFVQRHRFALSALKKNRNICTQVTFRTTF